MQVMQRKRYVRCLWDHCLYGPRQSNIFALINAKMQQEKQHKKSLVVHSKNAHDYHNAEIYQEEVVERLINKKSWQKIKRECQQNNI